jgi:hypothetical protein
MFSFSSVRSNSQRSASTRRRSWRGALVPLALFCLTLLFSGCQMGEDDFVDDHILNQNIIGTWTSEYNDSYIVTATTLSYDDGWGGNYGGAIKYISNFSGNAGVIIIEYDDNNIPTYYDDPEHHWGDPNYIIPLKGNFIGIYYTQLRPGDLVKMGTANEDGGAEAPTLDAAKEAFTRGKRGSYITWWGTYNKQP